MTLLELRSVTVGYDQVIALREATLSVDEGEFVVLLGANGAGKSTTLRAISRLVRLRSGAIWFGGARIDGLGPSRVTRTGIGHVPEGRRIFVEHTVQENLELGGYVLRRHRSRFDEAMAAVFGLFPRLAERRAQSAGTLSGGEAQMLAVGRALMSSPRLLMLDEPSLGLAPQLVAELFGYLSLLCRRDGITLLMVEQQAAAALEIADRGYVLDAGTVALEGSAESLRRDRAVRALYLGGRVEA
jgi:branched-chain amino acid transport system ATP-binding protein